MHWRIAKKIIKTKLEPTKNNSELFDLIQRGEKWLQENKFANALLKWETELWGENPADFGRK
jgi:ribonuclease HI